MSATARCPRTKRRGCPDTRPAVAWRLAMLAPKARVAMGTGIRKGPRPEDRGPASIPSSGRGTKGCQRLDRRVQTEATHRVGTAPPTVDCRRQPSGHAVTAEPQVRLLQNGAPPRSPARRRPLPGRCPNGIAHGRGRRTGNPARSTTGPVADENRRTGGRSEAERDPAGAGPRARALLGRRPRLAPPLRARPSAEELPPGRPGTNASHLAPRAPGKGTRRAGLAGTAGSRAAPSRWRCRSRRS